MHWSGHIRYVFFPFVSFMLLSHSPGLEDDHQPSWGRANFTGGFHGLWYLCWGQSRISNWWLWKYVAINMGDPPAEVIMIIQSWVLINNICFARFDGSTIIGCFQLGYSVIIIQVCLFMTSTKSFTDQHSFLECFYLKGFSPRLNSSSHHYRAKR